MWQATMEGKARRCAAKSAELRRRLREALEERAEERASREGGRDESLTERAVEVEAEVGEVEAEVGEAPRPRAFVHAEALLMERCVYHAYNETNAALRADVTRLAQEAEKERAAAREAQREAAEAEARVAQLRRA